jgi:hypothetical protein
LSRLLGLSRREMIALAAAFALTLPAVTPRIYASDEIQYFSYLRSLWFDRDVSFENEYRYFYDRNIGRGENFHATFLELKTEVGLRPNFGTLGAAILWAPFYAAGDVTARGLRALGREVAVDGFSQPYLSAVAYGSAWYGFAALVLAASAARQIHRRWNASGTREPADVVAAASIWAGTPLLFYMYVAPPYAHAASAFAVALFVVVWLHVRRTWSVGGAIALGLSGALMAMVREQDVFIALGPAADFALTAARAHRQPATGRSGSHYLRAAAAGCAAFLIGFLPQLLAYWALNGYPGPSGLVVRKMSWHSPHALHVLASPEHGFFLWTPLALIALAGLAVLVRRQERDVRRIAGCALLMVALQVYVSGSVDSWTVAGAYGQRRFVAVSVLLVIGLAAALRAVPAGPRAFAAAVAVALCVWWNLGLTAAFGIGLMNRQRLELSRNAYDVFVTVPALAPQLAIRYFSDRDSFYRQGQRQE